MLVEMAGKTSIPVAGGQTERKAEDNRESKEEEVKEAREIDGK